MKIERTDIGTIVSFKKGKYEASTTTEKYDDIIIDYDNNKEVLGIEVLDNYEGKLDPEVIQKIHEDIKNEMDYLSHKKLILQRALIALEKG